MTQNKASYVAHVGQSPHDVLINQATPCEIMICSTQNPALFSEVKSILQSNDALEFSIQINNINSRNKARADTHRESSESLLPCYPRQHRCLTSADIIVLEIISEGPIKVKASRTWMRDILDVISNVLFLLLLNLCDTTSFKPTKKRKTKKKGPHCSSQQAVTRSARGVPETAELRSLYNHFSPNCCRSGSAAKVARRGWQEIWEE